MNSTFTCPHCGLVSEIDPAHIGKSGPCRGCGKEVTVPYPKEASLPPTASSRGSSTPWLIGCAVIGALGVGVLGLLACAGLALFGVRSQQMQMQQEVIRVETATEQMREMAEQAEEQAKKASEAAEGDAKKLEDAAKELEKQLNEPPPP